MSTRIDKNNYYLNIALDVAKRSTCLRRCYGAVIVKNDEIISTGYNGAPRGRNNCSDCGICLRKELNIKSGKQYELCRSVHAEANAIISASRNEMIDSDLYLAGYDAVTKEELLYPLPCAMCERLIINAGIKRIITRNKEYLIKDLNDDFLYSKEELVKKIISSIRTMPVTATTDIHILNSLKEKILEELEILTILKLNNDLDISNPELYSEIIKTAVDSLYSNSDNIEKIRNINNILKMINN